MSCKHCYHLERPIATTFAEGLDQLLATLRGELAEGTLRETAPEVSRHPHAIARFESITADGPWPERPFSIGFACEFCGERFLLEIDPEEQFASWRRAEH